MVNMTNFFDRPQNEKRSQRPKLIKRNPEQCHTPQNGPTHMAKLPVSPVKPHRNEVWGILPDKIRSTLWLASLSQKAATQGSILETMTSTCSR